jgi:hypothetical protein
VSFKDKLDNCLVSLDVGNKNALFIVLAKDGTICRRGNGNPNKDLELLKGTSELEHFQAFMMTVSEDILQFSGFFEQTPIVGRPCKLMIVFSGPHGEEAGFKVEYGEDSQGPPADIVEMLINAVKLTDPWYEEELAKLQTNNGPTRPAFTPDISNAETTPSSPAIKSISGTPDSKKSWWKLW